MLSDGALFIVIALVWNIWYPINKEIWSSSFNVRTIGLSLIIMADFYFVIDVKGKSEWAFPFVIIGLNSITIYMLHHMVDFQYTTNFLLKGVLNITGDYASVILNVGIVLLQWFLLYFLYKKRIFLKI